MTNPAKFIHLKGDTSEIIFNLKDIVLLERVGESVCVYLSTGVKPLRFEGTLAKEIWGQMCRESSPPLNNLSAIPETSFPIIMEPAQFVPHLVRLIEQLATYNAQVRCLYFGIPSSDDWVYTNARLIDAYDHLDKALENLFRARGGGSR